MNNSDLRNNQLRYLKEIFQFEETRQTVIENKLSQLIGQSGLILSLISLFVPFFYDKINAISIFFKTILILLFVVGFVFFLLSLLYSAKTLNIRKYKYQTGSPTTVQKDHKSSEDFIKEEIEDLISIVNNNNKANNSKGTSLVNAGKYFTFGIITIGLLAIILTMNALFLKTENTSITISNQLDLNEIENSLNNIDTSLSKINNHQIIDSKKDSLLHNKLKSRN